MTTLVDNSSAASYAPELLSPFFLSTEQRYLTRIGNVRMFRAEFLAEYMEFAHDLLNGACKEREPLDG